MTDNAKAGQGLSVGSVIEYITLVWRPLAYRTREKNEPDTLVPLYDEYTTADAYDKKGEEVYRASSLLK